MNSKDLKLIVHVDRQRAELVVDDKLEKIYIVSTAARGVGCEENSFKTPPGLFAVSEKIGLDAVPGTVFKNRVPTGEIWSNDKANPLRSVPDDLILSRILWLEGREAHNLNTKNRYIYIHGTNHEDALGVPASQGCIRMRNDDVVELFDLLPVGSPVLIRAS
jgi:lipoprotein-anchoring transpeptidase ErfK/SrfK